MPRPARTRPLTPAPAPQARPPAGRFEGGLIAIDPDGAIGWVFCPDDPASLPEIELRDGPHVLARGRAGLTPDPRRESLTGPGVPGFVLPITQPPQSALPFPLSLHLAADGTELGRALIVRDPIALSWLHGQARMPANIQGRLDGLEQGVARGWALDPAWPGAPLLVQIRDFDQPIAEGRADQLREDLRAAGIGEGHCAFSIPLPVTLLDGRPHRLSAWCLDGSPLAGGPITFGPTQIDTLMERLAGLETMVRELQTQLEARLAPDGQMSHTLLQILAERLTALHTIRMRDIARELAALRARLPVTGPSGSDGKPGRRRR